MPAESAPIAPSPPVVPLTPESVKVVRLWPAVALITLFWVLHVIVGQLDKPYFDGFLYSMGSSAVLALLYFIWWWTNRQIRAADRLYGFVLILGAGAIVEPFCHPSIGWFGLLNPGLPFVLTVWTAWLLLVKMTSLSWKRLGSLVVVAATWGCFTLIRVEGVTAELKADVRWRWSPTAEELFLAERTPAEAVLSPDWTRTVTAGDWPEFRGPARDGVIRGVTLATDWSSSPPRLLWRHRVGPAWSSVIVIGDRLFTQEQRGEMETVVCYDAATGKELWVHEDSARFWEPVSGAGPRATPTFANGRIYTLGGTGILNCLAAATGKQHWSRNVAAEAGARVPLWGFSGSPLILADLVVVFAGGDGDKNLLAYRTATGEPAWAAPAGQTSYSSPQAATIAGKRQCLILSNHGLTAVDPVTGAVLWKNGVVWPPEAPRTVQPHVVGATQLVVGTLDGPGVALIELSQEGDAWNARQRWTSKDLKPEFPDFVVHQGHAYGFDVSIFCCIDLATGKRCWKAGRYGRGQVMLLADQSLLLVVAESGEMILLAANPQRQEELGRFRALDGKTWNHPVIAHGHLYVRNTEEMACYEVAAK